MFTSEYILGKHEYPNQRKATTLVKIHSIKLPYFIKKIEGSKEEGYEEQTQSWSIENIERNRSKTSKIKASTSKGRI